MLQATWVINISKPTEVWGLFAYCIVVVCICVWILIYMPSLALAGLFRQFLAMFVCIDTHLTPHHEFCHQSHSQTHNNLVHTRHIWDGICVYNYDLTIIIILSFQPCSIYAPPKRKQRATEKSWGYFTTIVIGDLQVVLAKLEWVLIIIGRWGW